MTCKCKTGSCLWSESGKICEMLINASIPLDDRWPVLILYLRSIGNDPFLTEVQKSFGQEILVSILESQDYSPEMYAKQVTLLHEMFTKPYAQKMTEVVREIESLGQEVTTLLGRQRERVQIVSEHVEAAAAKGVEPAVLISGIRAALKNVMQKMEHDMTLLAELSQKDALTGLANRRCFDAFLSSAVQEWQEQGSKVALIMIDVDNFKGVNDTYGHSVGDLVLCHVARQMEAIARYLDGGATKVMTCRYGGEEFALIIQGPQADAAPFAAEQLRLSVGGVPVAVPAREGSTARATITCTISLGISYVCSSWPSAFEENLVDTADKALYTAKSLGKNCTVAYIPEQGAYELVEKMLEPLPLG